MRALVHHKIRLAGQAHHDETAQGWLAPIGRPTFRHDKRMAATHGPLGRAVQEMLIRWKIVTSIALCLCAGLAAQSLSAGEIPGGIWPEQGSYIGAKKCAVCHPNQARSYASSQMSHAMESPGPCDFLDQNPRMTWSEGDYQYLIEKRDNRYDYRVTDGTATAETPLAFALGHGQSQTYVFQRDGRYYESRVSYYRKLGGLALTLGAPAHKPANVQEALGRPLDDAEARECFGCHSTGARRGDKLQFEVYENGVQCEACHGPGAGHLASIADGRPKPGSIRSGKGMTAAQATALCGSCHRTLKMVLTRGLEGVKTVRFQPFRLSLSKCYVPGDPRIACTACHDPHVALVTGDGAYDSKCLACHKTDKGTARQKRCPVAQAGCTSCHMPRYELPGAHQSFADHRIRVVHANDPYPE